MDNFLFHVKSLVVFDKSLSEEFHTRHKKLVFAYPLDGHESPVLQGIWDKQVRLYEALDGLSDTLGTGSLQTFESGSDVTLCGAHGTCCVALCLAKPSHEESEECTYPEAGHKYRQDGKAAPNTKEDTSRQGSPKEGAGEEEREDTSSEDALFAAKASPPLSLADVLPGLADIPPPLVKAVLRHLLDCMCLYLGGPLDVCVRTMGVHSMRRILPALCLGWIHGVETQGLSVADLLGGATPKGGAKLAAADAPVYGEAFACACEACLVPGVMAAAVHVNHQLLAVGGVQTSQYMAVDALYRRHIPLTGHRQVGEAEEEEEGQGVGDIGGERAAWVRERLVGAQIIPRPTPTPTPSEAELSYGTGHGRRSRLASALPSPPLPCYLELGLPPMDVEEEGGEEKAEPEDTKAYPPVRDCLLPTSHLNPAYQVVCDVGCRNEGGSPPKRDRDRETRYTRTVVVRQGEPESDDPTEKGTKASVWRDGGGDTSGHVHRVTGRFIHTHTPYAVSEDVSDRPVRGRRPLEIPVCMAYPDCGSSTLEATPAGHSALPRGAVSPTSVMEEDGYQYIQSSPAPGASDGFTTPPLQHQSPMSQRVPGSGRTPSHKPHTPSGLGVHSNRMAGQVGGEAGTPSLTVGEGEKDERLSRYQASPFLGGSDDDTETEGSESGSEGESTEEEESEEGDVGQEDETTTPTLGNSTPVTDPTSPHTPVSEGSEAVQVAPRATLLNQTVLVRQTPLRARGKAKGRRERRGRRRGVSRHGATPATASPLSLSVGPQALLPVDVSPVPSRLMTVRVTVEREKASKGRHRAGPGHTEGEYVPVGGVVDLVLLVKDPSSTVDMDGQTPSVAVEQDRERERETVWDGVVSLCLQNLGMIASQSVRPGLMGVCDVAAACGMSVPEAKADRDGARHFFGVLPIGTSSARHRPLAVHSSTPPLSPVLLSSQSTLSTSLPTLPEHDILHRSGIYTQGGSLTRMERVGPSTLQSRLSLYDAAHPMLSAAVLLGDIGTEADQGRERERVHSVAVSVPATEPSCAYQRGTDSLLGTGARPSVSWVVGSRGRNGRTGLYLHDGACINIVDAVDRATRDDAVLFNVLGGGA
ncbi:hypothetical protein KIPB_004900 [Kipferlia bialata]|uniref:Uncharacterized protein n=1 Tax=Kipferlia bialata TaxID=797122 RepID=A0A9K3CW66_9EUKA|nr:hypothetical protein KIPB_004900 [Kipferlia bialata]|eukprot:g4900.t1